MKRRKQRNLIAAALPFAVLCTAVDPLAAMAQAPPAASAPVPQAGSFLLTIFLRPSRTSWLMVGISLRAPLPGKRDSAAKRRGGGKSFRA